MEGWAWPYNSNKRHYFKEDKMSLCGKWAYFGSSNDFRDNAPDDSGNCKACMKKLILKKGIKNA